MVISDRLKTIREQKDLSQGDIEERTGLKRCYVSRVENGHTVPSIETLEKLARALEVPLYQFFYDGEAPPELQPISTGASSDNGGEWGNSGESARFFERLRQLLGRLSEPDRKLILHMTSQMVRKNRP
jgi:transcriptional regulator with XRE-family HTH domain